MGSATNGGITLEDIERRSAEQLAETIADKQHQRKIGTHAELITPHLLVDVLIMMHWQEIDCLALQPAKIRFGLRETADNMVF